MWIAPLFIKRPEIAKTTALAAQNGIFNDKVEIITEVKEDLVWWTKNVSDFSSPVVREKNETFSQSRRLLQEQAVEGSVMARPPGVCGLLIKVSCTPVALKLK